MRSTAHLKGHPIHPMLVGFPVAYLLGSACLDVLARTTRRPALSQTARHLNAMGLGSAVAAAVPGIVDYFNAVPPRSSAKKRATQHAIANLSALTLFAASRAARRGPRQSLLGIAAEVIGSGLLTAAGWMGGTLVYRNQIAVDHRYADAGRWADDEVKVIGEPASIDIGPADVLGVDQMKLLRVAGQRIVLARTEEGYTAFDDRCTHKGGPLSDGVLICGTVQCPWHGSQFNVRTGSVKHGPAEEGIRSYRVDEKDGRLFLDRTV
jgi:nitrite reductase/ring-hydroxylating ferredoxin subunit/uncharacterized membrane protein